jgi:hypothetical protein
MAVILYIASIDTFLVFHSLLFYEEELLDWAPSLMPEVDDDG